MSEESIFRNPELVERGLELPNVISFRFVGTSGHKYYSLLLGAIEGVVQRAQIKRQVERRSRTGRYISYQFDIFCADMQEVESIYRAVGKLSDTKFVL
jgi:putative lipoic acid-binding regulatory protein